MEPIGLNTARGTIKVDGTWSDMMIANLIRSGRQAAENFTNMSIPIQTLELAFDSYPPKTIKLPKGPLISLEAITLTDRDGVASSIPTTSYIEDTLSSAIVLKDSANIQTVTLQEANGFIVEYKAGHGEVPETIQDAIMLYVKAQFDCIPPEEWIPSFERLLFPYKVVGV